MKVFEANIKDIKPYPNNPRIITNEAIEKVANSIKEFGMQQPIVVDKDMVIIVGHTRLKACESLGMGTVPCVIADNLSDEQVKAYRLADNKTNEFTDWNLELLDFELEDLFKDNFDMEQFGFELDLEGEEDKEIVEDEVPNEVPSVVKEHEVWKLGRHILMCGDSTQEEDVKKLMGGGIADMLITDPPYGVSYVGKTKDSLKIENDSKEDSEFINFLTDSFNAGDSVLKEGGVFYIWHADSRGYVFRVACKNVNWEIRQCLVWVKQSMVLGRQDYQWKHEPCLYGWKEGSAHLWASDRKQTTVLEFDRPMKNLEHPTMKPVNLFAYLIKNSSKKDDIILDLFGGSGTTIIACEQLERSARVMELSPHYCDVIIQRWENLTGEKAVKIAG
nr:MAG TPA_asm: adenine specific DNA methyltransferase [Caudoviricetes sp.]